MVYHTTNNNHPDHCGFLSHSDCKRFPPQLEQVELPLQSDSSVLNRCQWLDRYRWWSTELITGGDKTFDPWLVSWVYFTTYVMRGSACSFLNRPIVQLVVMCLKPPAIHRVSLGNQYSADFQDTVCLIRPIRWHLAIVNPRMRNITERPSSPMPTPMKDEKA